MRENNSNSLVNRMMLYRARTSDIDVTSLHRDNLQISTVIAIFTKRIRTIESSNEKKKKKRLFELDKRNYPKHLQLNVLKLIDIGTSLV